MEQEYGFPNDYYLIGSVKLNNISISYFSSCKRKCYVMGEVQSQSGQF